MKVSATEPDTWATKGAGAYNSQQRPARLTDSTEPEPLTLGLLLIVALKAATGLLLWTGFVLLLFARGSDPQTFTTHLVIRLFRGNPPGIAIRWIATNMAFVTPVMLTRTAVATAVYAVVESVEAVGLLLRKLWAEWLVILVTASFIPLEIFEIVLHPTPLRGGTLIVNLAILWYLLKLRTAKARAKRQAARHLRMKNEE